MTRMLTKDERHMLRAALDVLRANVIAEPGRRGGIAHRALLNAQLRLDVGATLSGAEWWAPVLVQTLVTVWSYTVRPVLGSRHERRHRERILRARLALAIRAVLRADRGDCGPIECTGCGAPSGARRAGYGCRECWLEHWQTTGDVISEEEWPRYERVLITPLWTTAPGHEVDR